jgi:hypothetical protein
LLLTALLCIASCNTSTAPQDMSAPTDLAGACPATQPMTGARCPQQLAMANIACTYGAMVCRCGGEGDWACFPQRD